MRRDRFAKEKLQLVGVERRRAGEDERLHGVVVFVVVLAQKAGFDFENAVERKAADVEQVGDRRCTEMHQFDRGSGVDLKQAFTQALAVVGAH